MKNQEIEKVEKVRKISKKVEPKVLTLQIGKVILTHDKKGLTYHVPQGMSGAQLTRFITTHRGLIEAFRTS